MSIIGMLIAGVGILLVIGLIWLIIKVSVKILWWAIIIGVIGFIAKLVLTALA